MELVVAIGVGVLLISAIFSVIFKSMSVLKNISEVQRAYTLSQNQMELLCSLPSSELKTGTREFSPLFAGEMHKFKHAEDTITISHYKKENGLLTIEVCFRWEIHKGRKKEVKLITLKRNE